VSRREWAALTHGVPVLMYHAFSASGEEDRYIVSKRSFARQMRLLKALRYRAITFEELARTLRESRLPPLRSVVITIDDGYADNLDVAYPILRRHGLNATLFLISDRLGRQNDWSSGPPMLGRPLLSEEQIARMDGGSIEFGAHTRTHPSLPDVPDDQVREEIDGSRAELEQLFGTPVNTFAYPFGRRDDRAVAAVKQSGLIGAAITRPRLARPNDDPAQIPRIEIMGSDTTWRFLAKLWFGVQ
jgi:peptidoglycan/xylan/chitin deacetylase (PgdA/CDA1 family)